jgi:hypothetical protein
MWQQTPGVFVFNFDDCEVYLDVRKAPALALRVRTSLDLRVVQNLHDVSPQELRKFCGEILADALPAKFACRKWPGTYFWVAEEWRPSKHIGGRQLAGAFRQGIGPLVFTQHRFTAASNVIREFCDSVMTVVSGNEQKLAGGA